MASESDLVELTTVSTAFEGEWLVGALKTYEVSAVVFGESLADEFAMSQKLMGLSGGVRVMVPRSQLDRAQRALVEIDENKPTQEELEAAMAAAGAAPLPDEPAPSAAAPRRSGGLVALLVFLVAAVLVLGGLYLSALEELVHWERASPLTTTRWTGDRWEYHWKDNGRLSAIYLDRNRNGIYEESWYYDRGGRLQVKSFDKNENEVAELSILCGPDFEERTRQLDENENGIVERVEYAAEDGVVERWLDADEDLCFERREFVDAESGEILDAFEDRGREGMVRVK